MKATFIGSSCITRLDRYVRNRNEDSKFTTQFLGKSGAGFRETEAQIPMIDTDTDVVFMYVGGNEVKPDIPIKCLLARVRRLIDKIGHRIGLHKKVVIINLYGRLKPTGWDSAILYNRKVCALNKRMARIPIRSTGYLNTFNGYFRHSELCNVLGKDGVHLNTKGQMELWQSICEFMD